MVTESLLQFPLDSEQKYSCRLWSAKSFPMVSCLNRNRDQAKVNLAQNQYANVILVALDKYSPQMCDAFPNYPNKYIENEQPLGLQKSMAWSSNVHPPGTRLLIIWEEL